jgi:hypothetical protein
MNRTIKLSLAALVALVLGSSSIVKAVPAVLTISDGLGDTVSLSVGGTVVIGGTAVTTTSMTAAGLVSWSGSIGSIWTITMDAGVTKPLSGSAQLPNLGLTFAASSSAAGNLTITWSDSDFGPSSGNLEAAIGGTLNNSGESIAYSTLYSTADTVPAGTSLTSPLDFSGTGGFNDSTVASVGPLAYAYSLTEDINITNTAAGSLSGSATLHSVPDAGNTLLLLGAAIGALGMFGAFAGCNRQRSEMQMKQLAQGNVEFLSGDNRRC